MKHILLSGTEDTSHKFARGPEVEIMSLKIVLTQPSRPLQDLAADWDVGDQVLLQGLVQVCLPRSNIPEVEIVSLKNSSD